MSFSERIQILSLQVWGIGHRRAQFTFKDDQSMVEPARSTIRYFSDRLDATVANILYRLETEEYIFKSLLEEDSVNEESDAAVVEIPQDELTVQPILSRPC